MKMDLIKYSSSSITAGVALYLYNILVDGRPYNNKINLYDVGTMMGSVVISKVVKDLIIDFLNVQHNSIQSYAIEPIVNAFVYDYGYTKLVKENFNVDSRWNNFILFIGFVVGTLSAFLENPMIGILTNMKVL